MLGKQDKEKIDWFLKASMDEILVKSAEEDWEQSRLDNWVRFKTAQFLERIAFKRKER